MKLINIFLFLTFCFNLYISRLFSKNQNLNIFLEEKEQKKNTNQNDIENAKKEKEITNLIKKIKLIDKDTDDLVNDIKQKMNKINGQHKKLNNSFTNLKNAIYINSNQNLKPKIFLFLIIIMAMIIYIIELKYEKNKVKNHQNINKVGMSYNFDTYNHQNGTKLYLSL